MNENQDLDRDKIIKVARSWLGTPWHHNQRQKGVGVDCANFIVGTIEECGYPRLDLGNYSKRPEGDSLLRIMEQYGVETDNIAQGDVLVFAAAFKGPPTHLGFAVENEESIGLIHADSRRGEVVEISSLGCWVRLLRKIYEPKPKEAWSL